MRDSSSIKKANKNIIRELLRNGADYTKQEMAVKTGLSVASCNTFLNEMEKSGEVIGEKCRLREVGPSTAVYRMNEDYESILCVIFQMLNQIKTIQVAVLTPTGRTREQWENVYPVLDAACIEQEIEKAFKKYSNISQIMLGTPSIAEHGIIRHCDIAELENEEIVQRLTGRFNCPVDLENDMHLKALGYYFCNQCSGGIVTLGCFSSGVLPGTATVYEGTVLKGKNLFAGMVGFMDYGRTMEEVLASLKDPVLSRPLIVRAMTAVISVLNPHYIVLAGDLINSETVAQIRRECCRTVPEEYMPEFSYIEAVDGYYLEGMFRKAVRLSLTER